MFDTISVMKCEALKLYELITSKKLRKKYAYYKNWARTRWMLKTLFLSTWFYGSHHFVETIFPLNFGLFMNKKNWKNAFIIVRPSDFKY